MTLPRVVHHGPWSIIRRVPADPGKADAPEIIGIRFSGLDYAALTRPDAEALSEALGKYLDEKGQA